METRAVSARLEATDVERFRAAVALHLGLQLNDAKLDSLAELLSRRTRTLAQDPASYVSQLEGPLPPAYELRELVRELTVSETYFFRHGAQFQAFADVALPCRLAARAGRGPVRVLSLGCASGEEPFSLAMLACERALEPGRDVSLRAVDANPAMLAKAAHGRYSEWSLRETPESTRRRWFSAHGRAFVLDPSIREAVVFEERNLAAENADLWQRAAYDVVFCRNVIMYFTATSAEALVGNIGRALAPGGFLFLGHAETLRGLSEDFDLRQSHGAFYYQRKPGAPRTIGGA
jgi:chemotaxis protein methyltransferase CheR